MLSCYSCGFCTIVTLEITMNGANLNFVQTRPPGLVGPLLYLYPGLCAQILALASWSLLLFAALLRYVRVFI